MSGGICGRCLIHLSAAGYVVARWRDGDIQRSEPARYVTDPVALRAWAEDILTRSGGDAKFEIDGTSQRMIAFDTWNGDEVCSVHLYMLAEAEIKRWGR